MEACYITAFQEQFITWGNTKKQHPELNTESNPSDGVQENLYRDSEEISQMLTKVFSVFVDYKYLLLSL